MSRDYCAVSAKLKAMYGRRLKREDFEALLLKKSVPEICAALKKTEAYGEAFADTDEQQAHRGEVEKVLEQCFYEEYERLYSFVDAKKRELLRLWLVRLETDVLSEALRHISNAESTEQRKVSEFFVRHTGIDTDALCKAKSLAEAAAACKNTRYYDVLNRADRAGSEFFSIAMTLDRDYFVLAKKAAQKYLDGEEQKIFSELYEDTAELLNVMWIYRGKKYFGFDADLIYTYLLPLRRRIKPDELAAMVSAPDADAVAAIAAKTPAGVLFSAIADGIFPEEMYRRETARLSRRILRDSPDTMAAVFAYLNLKELEIKTITMIIEAVRYGHNPDAARRHIMIF